MSGNRWVDPSTVKKLQDLLWEISTVPESFNFKRLGEVHDIIADLAATVSLADITIRDFDTIIGVWCYVQEAMQPIDIAVRQEFFKCVGGFGRIVCNGPYKGDNYKRVVLFTLPYNTARTQGRRRKSVPIYCTLDHAEAPRETQTKLFSKPLSPWVYWPLLIYKFHDLGTEYYLDGEPTFGNAFDTKYEKDTIEYLSKPAMVEASNNWQDFTSFYDEFTFPGEYNAKKKAGGKTCRYGAMTAYCDMISRKLRVLEQRSRRRASIMFKYNKNKPLIKPITDNLSLYNGVHPRTSPLIKEVNWQFAGDFPVKEIIRPPLTWAS